MHFAAGYVGLLSEVKFFMSRFTRANYVDILKFQGSSDGTTYTDLFTVGDEIHEGWNYYTYASGAEPKYRYYRFYGTAAGSCNVGEVVFKGYEVINNSQNSYSCTPVLTLGGTTYNLATTVTYTSTLTPVLSSISPRYGTV